MRSEPEPCLVGGDARGLVQIECFWSHRGRGFSIGCEWQADRVRSILILSGKSHGVAAFLVESLTGPRHYNIAREIASWAPQPPPTPLIQP